MRNRDISRVFHELAEREQVASEPVYKVAAYRKAADNISKLPVSVEFMTREGRLQELEGVGPAIAKKISDLIETGTFDALDRARARVPDGMLRLTRAPGVGVPTAHLIWETIGAESFDDVIGAARDGRLVAIQGVGPKTVAAIVDFATNVPEDMEPAEDPDVLLRRNDAEKASELAMQLVAERVPHATCTLVGGPLARGAEVIDHISVLALADDPAVAAIEITDAICACGWQSHGRSQRITIPAHDDVTVMRAAFEAPTGAGVDVIVCTPGHEAFGTVASVGPAKHADEVFAALPGAATMSVGETNGAAADVPLYEAAGFQWVPFEIRERPDVLELAAAKSLPELVTVTDYNGELHCHSTWTDGRQSIVDMCAAAQALGDSFIAITDHSAPLAMVGGLDADKLAQQADEIALVRAELAGSGFMLLHGSEVEVLDNGGLGLDDETLAKLDWAVASIHTGQKQDRETITKRMEYAMRCPYIDAIGHPTSRMLLKRPSTALDTDRLIELAVETGTFLEINANPHRLDLDSSIARQALEAGVKLVINSDAHTTETLPLRRHGIAVGRRAGATAKDVVNCMTLDELRALQKRNR